MERPDTFIAIDVETATGQGHICQIGLVRIEKERIVGRKVFLVRPEDNRYDYWNTMIHGICPEDTADAPAISELWPKLYAELDGQVIVGHNLTFDLQQFRKDAARYGLPMFRPRVEICTCRLHGRASLSDVARYYRIPLPDHHNALCDAECSAMILLKYQEAGTACPHVPRSRQSGPSYIEARRIEPDTKRQDLQHCICRDTVFYDKRVVITGVLDRFPKREEIARILKALGADVNTSISRRTDIVIVGKDPGPRKVEKIRQLEESGADILVMNEQQLDRILEEAHISDRMG